MNKKAYKDMDKFIKARNRQRKRNYKKTQLYEPHMWSTEDEHRVLEHSITDIELSRQMKHSVQAIQIKRSRLNKAVRV